MTRARDHILYRMTAAFMAAVIAFLSFTLPAQAQRANMPLIRDAEIEGLLRLYLRPIFKAAGINPKSVRVYLIADDRINAFVAGGQRIFVHTGLLMKAPTPNTVIGVLAHETGHIAGGHLARMGFEIEKASVTSIVGMLVGLAAIAGGAATGTSGAGQAGSGIFMGSQGLAQRNFLAYARDMEASADQAALRYLNATGQSPKGMLELFEKLGRESIATLKNVDPYVMSHPMPFERIRNLEEAAKRSKYYNVQDPPALMLRHQLMQAKLVGFIYGPQLVMQRYPVSDGSLPARYARAIAMFRKGDIRNALPVIETLTAELPQNPYFWELKGQALLENGRPAEAIAPLEQAVKLLPNSGLIQLLLAQALIATEKPANAQRAVRVLKQAQRSEGGTPLLFDSMARAYGIMNEVALAALSTAESAYLRGDKKLALEKAKIAQGRFKMGTPEWLRANDLVTFAGRD